MTTAQTSTFKLNEQNATAQQRYHFIKLVEQMFKSRSITDKRTKKDYSLSWLADLLQYYIPKKEEMSQSASGNYHFRDFGQNHYTQNAK